MDDFSFFFQPADDRHVKQEKQKAKDLRQSAWWKNQLGKSICYYCKSRVHPSELTMDHVVPIIRGGKTSRSNVVTACKNCNNQKKYMLPLEWQEYLRGLRAKAREQALQEKNTLEQADDNSQES